MWIYIKIYIRHYLNQKYIIYILIFWVPSSNILKLNSYYSLLLQIKFFFMNLFQLVNVKSIAFAQNFPKTYRQCLRTIYKNNFQLNSITFAVTIFIICVYTLTSSFFKKLLFIFHELNAKFFRDRWSLLRSISTT